MSELTRLPAIELQGLLNAGEVSSVELVSAHLERMEQVEPTVKAFLHVSDHALDEAKAIDDKRAKGEELPATAGLPLAVKDVLCTSDMPTTSGSRAARQRRARRSATSRRRCSWPTVASVIRPTPDRRFSSEFT